MKATAKGITVTVVKRFRGSFDDMSDQEIIKWLLEDIAMLTDAAEWNIQRSQEERK